MNRVTCIEIYTETKTVSLKHSFEQPTPGIVYHATHAENFAYLKRSFTNLIFYIY